MNTEKDQQQKMTFVLPRVLMERLRALAKQHHRSLTGELLVVIETYLNQQDEPHD
jgi:predicted DNA-binding protein